MNAHTALGIAAALGALTGYMLGGERNSELEAAGVSKSDPQVTLLSQEVDSRSHFFIVPSVAEGKR